MEIWGLLAPKLALGKLHPITLLEVTIGGPVNPATGMETDLGLLDETVEREGLERFDHTHSNLDVETFRNLAPTTENPCIEIHNLLRPKVEG